MEELDEPIPIPKEKEHLEIEKPMTKQVRFLEGLIINDDLQRIIPCRNVQVATYLSVSPQVPLPIQGGGELFNSSLKSMVNNGYLKNSEKRWALDRHREIVQDLEDAKEKDEANDQLEKDLTRWVVFVDGHAIAVFSTREEAKEECLNIAKYIQ
jgi:hypothetical protein